MDAPDQILLSGRLASGAAVATHFQGGEPRGFDGFVWDIHGTKGDLRMTGPTGHTQIVPLTIHGARGDDRALWPIPIVDDDLDLADDVPGNVARISRRLAHDLRHGASRLDLVSGRCLASA